MEWRVGGQEPEEQISKWSSHCSLGAPYYHYRGDLTSEHSEGVVANPYINIQNVNKASFYPKKVSKKNK